MLDNLCDVALKNRSGKFVRLTVLSTRAAVSCFKEMKNDFRVSLVNQRRNDAYPIAGLTRLLVYRQQKDAIKAKKVDAAGRTS